MTSEAFKTGGGQAVREVEPAKSGPFDRIGDVSLYWCLGGLLAAWIVATMPWWHDGRVIPWDAKNQFYPMLRWLAAEIHAGHWPIWMAEIFAGRSTLADPQSMVLSPSFVLVALLDPAPSMRMADMAVLADLLLGGIAILLLGRVKRIHPAAALLAALVFMFGGAATARLQHVLLVQSYSWTPVVLLAVELAIRKPTLMRGAAVGLAGGLLAIGRDQVAFLGLIAAAGWAAAGIAQQPDLRRWLARAWPAMTLAGVLAAIVALPPVLATLQFAKESNRPVFTYDYVAWGSLPPVSLLTGLSGDYFAGLFDIAGYWGPGRPGWEDAPAAAEKSICQLYAGVAAAVLVVWLGALRGWLGRSGGRLATAILVLALLYALGDYTPFFGWAFELVPGVDKFRRPADAAFIVNLGLTLTVMAIAGRYLDSGLGTSSTRRVLAEAGAAAAILALALLVAWQHEALEAAALSVLTSAAAACVVVALLVWGARGDRRRRIAAIAILAAGTATDLSVFGTGTTLNAHFGDIYRMQEAPEEDPLASWLTARVAEIEAYEGPVRVTMLGLGGPWQNMSAILGIENTLGYNPLRLGRYETATGAGQNSHYWKRDFGALMKSWRDPFASMLGIRLLVLGMPIEKIDRKAARAFGEPVRIGNAWIYENRHAFPRAFMVRADRVRPNTDRLLKGEGPLPALDWRTEALIGSHRALPRPAAAAGGDTGLDAGSVRILSWRPGFLRVAVSAKADAYLILNELRYTGWTATVDGERRPLVPANALFQAVHIRPGDRVVEFAFSPLVELLGAL